MARNLEDVYPLSPLQRGILFHAVAEPGEGLYVDQLVSDLEAPGGLREGAFRDACQDLFDRHGSLRTAFSWEKREEPLQVVLRQVALPLAVEDWRRLPAVEREARLRERLEAERRRGFDLSRPPLVRLSLLRTGDETYRFVFSYHHILLDAWSAGVLLRELTAAYEARVGGRAPSLPGPRPFGDYLRWLARNRPPEAEAFWRREAEALEAPAPIGLERPREGGVPVSAGEAELHLDEPTTEAVRELARRARVTFYAVVQGAWALLLQRYGAGRQVVFGLASAGRPAGLAGVETMVGLFINTLPVRVEVEEGETVTRWLRGLHQRLVELRRYEHVPLYEIQSWTSLPPRTPLFESVVAFENVPGAGDHPGDALRFTAGRYLFRTNYPLNLLAVPGRRLLLRINYDGMRFAAGGVERFLADLATVLRGLAADPERRLDDVPVLDAAHRHAVLHAWNGTPAAPAAEHGVHRRVERWAAEAPDRLAVEAPDGLLTYGELDRLARNLAWHLREVGVGCGSRVGVFAARSREMVVAVLAVLEAGAAYVPLDPAYPRHRLGSMVEDAALAALLVQPGVGEGPPPFSGPRLDLTLRLPTAWDAPSSFTSRAVLPEQAAYVIFTSGSTGRPKGIVCTHGGLLHMLPAWNDLFHVTADERVLQFASFSFDASVWETFSALTAGATLCFGSRSTLYGADELLTMLRSLRVTRALLPPSLLGAMAPEGLRELSRLASIGERCTASVVERWARGCEVFNAYGPAEATITTTVYRAVPGCGATGPPIGRPLAGTRQYLLDSRLRPVPVGVAGELALAGPQLARGYLGRPAATAERFVPEPFSGAAGERLYRTGDLGRFRATGDVELLGRVDQQVKVRGVRIELGEVEAVLRRHPDVVDAVAVSRPGPDGRPRLVAYAASPAAPPPAAQDLRAFLRGSLPDLMMPNRFVVLDRFPLSPNGKVDRGMLPEPDWDADSTARPFEVPGTPRERMLARIWEEVLRVPRVGRHDDFFDLGGDSILSIQILARARRAGLALSPKQLFAHPTVAELAQVAEETTAEAARRSRPGPFPPTPIQRWFLDGAGWTERPVDGTVTWPGNHFNQALLLESRAGLPPADALARALALLPERHDALRLRLARRAGEGVLELPATGPPPPSSTVASRAGAAVPPRHVLAAVQRSLDLTRGPLLRAVRFTGGRSERLLLVAHHMAVDAVSWRLILEELATAASAFAAGTEPSLPPVSTGFAEWARRLQDHARSGALDDQLPYWRETLRAAHRLPSDGAATDDTVAGARVVERSLDRTATGDLGRHGAQGRRGVEGLLLAALAAVLGRWTGKGEVVVDLESHGRGDLVPGVDLSRTVGWLTAMAPIRLPAAGPALDRLAGVERVRAVWLERAVGFGALRHLRRDLPEAAPLRELPGPDLVFNFLGHGDAVVPPGAEWTPLAADVGPLRSPRLRRRHRLEVDCLIHRGSLVVRWTHGPAHRREVVEGLADDLVAEIAALLSASGDLSSEAKRSRGEAPEAAEAPGAVPPAGTVSGLSATDLALVLEEMDEA